MGICLSQYRASIGLFNRVSFKSVCSSVSFPAAFLYCIALLIVILLYRSGDIELNPGPNSHVKIRTLNVCHVNIYGMNQDSKLRAIKTGLADIYDVITISETLLKPHSKVNLRLSGFYDIMRRDRPDFGGGVAIYVKECISYKRLYEAECKNIEVMWLQLNTIEGKILLCNAYRPPDYGGFWEHFDRNIEYVKEKYDAKYMLILGDLNGDFSTDNGTHLKNVCSNHNLLCHIYEPTRITDKTRTCLDQIISNMPNFISQTYVSPPVSTNDHCTVGVNLDLKIPKEPPYERIVWDYKHGDYPGFRTALETANWEQCFDGDVNDVCAKWSDTFLCIARRFIPCKEVLIRPNDKPWFNNALRLLRRKVKRLFHKAKKSKSTEHWEDYKKERNNYQSELDDAEETYKKSKAESLVKSRNTKEWWGTVKDMLGRGGQDTYPTMHNSSENTFVSDNKSKADLFNSFFLSHSNIDTSHAELPADEVFQNAPFLENIVTTEAEVADLLKCIDPTKATGPDGISPRLLKEAGLTIVPSLTKLFNLSLSTAKVPLEWKKANVTPIHKKDDRSFVNNYRPISILCVLSKLLEKIVFKHVYNFLHEHGLLTRFQSGFIPGDSTVNQLAFLYHTLSKALDEKKDVRIVFCDISKAFDKVWHSGIIFKLKQIGIRGVLLEWFRDYLQNRLQRVVIRGQNSDWGEIKAGVPQGSVLGPLLFLIYINDIVNGVNSNIRLFADDTTLYISVDDPNNVTNATDAATQLNDDMITIKSWADQWLVTFNPTKTKTMTITNKKVEHPPLYFDNTELKSVKEHKHLGLTFKSNLSWSSHTSEIVQNGSKMCDVLKKFKYQIDRKSLETIYFSFIRPKLEYACSVWDDCTERDKIALDNVQHNAARIVTGAKKGTSHALVHDELQWPSLSERRTQFKLKHMHRIVHNTAPSYLSDILPAKVNVGARYNFRDNNNFVQFNCNTVKFSKSLFPDCIDKWNSLDDKTKAIDDIEHFKSAIVNESFSNPLYYVGQRKANIIHSQLRMKCSNLNDHLVKLHVKDDPKCLCTYKLENNKHYLLDCPLYHTHRVKLQNIVSAISRCTVKILLYGDKNLNFEQNCIIFKAVQDYITDSGRFN